MEKVLKITTETNDFLTNIEIDNSSEFKEMSVIQKELSKDENVEAFNLVLDKSCKFRDDVVLTINHKSHSFQISGRVLDIFKSFINL